MGNSCTGPLKSLEHWAVQLDGSQMSSLNGEIGSKWSFLACESAAGTMARTRAILKIYEIITENSSSGQWCETAEVT